MTQYTEIHQKNNVLDPARSVFVSANAGSGKTRLLVDRVLSLLMHGVAPGRILCISFTNNAASEMSRRITETLGRWVMQDEAVLRQELETLLGVPMTRMWLVRARGLFAHVLEAPVGLRLQTIHGFCQSLLARFPLEAEVALHHAVLDDSSAQSLLKEARLRLCAGAEEVALPALVQQLGEHSLLALLSEWVGARPRLAQCLEQYHGIEGAVAAIYRAYAVSQEDQETTLLERYLKTDAAHLSALRAIADRLAQSDKETNQKTAAHLHAWCAEDAGPRVERLQEYLAGFFVSSGERAGKPKKNLVTKHSVPEQDEALLLQEQEAVIACRDALAGLRDARFSAAVLRMGAAWTAQYDALKHAKGLMDFDDQILAARRLLSRKDASQWVMYKLDGGVDHILVDEAQDTSPAQWEIIRALTEEFFSGHGKQEGARSLFVVGDEKQSIFRFQGADPAGLSQHREFFLERIERSRRQAESIALQHSYRSAPEILALVDQVFASDAARAGLTAQDLPVRHHSKRGDARGYACLWPLTPASEDGQRSAELELARAIAGQIAAWIQQGIGAGEVLVLVRRRTAFVAQLARALKRREIPVAGVDRMNLLAHVAVQDLLAFIQILLLPEDDLTLACLLKSPIFGWDEEMLFQDAHGRTGHLWEAIAGTPAHALLVEFRAKSDWISPYTLLSELLDARGIRRAFTGRMGEEVAEILDMLLEQALSYEQGATPSLLGFLTWMRAADTELKRDMEHASGQVRIMTVHGAKGLEARAVILADSTAIPTVRERLYWHEGLPCATVKMAEASNFLKLLRQKEQAQEMEEYRRLLYVALTRAADILLVCGAEHGRAKEGAQEGSWYRLVEPAIAALGAPLEGGGYAYGEMHVVPVSSPATSQDADAQPLPLLPDILEEQAAVPLRLTPAESFALPQSEAQAIHRVRGIALHRLLQYLPLVPVAARASQGRLIAAREAPMLDADALVAEAIAVLEHPELAHFFGGDALAEVPVSGRLEWQGERRDVSGQIDRLYLDGETLWVIDYKTTPTPPDTPPQAYVTQLSLYAGLMQQIYPTQKIRTVLLWTAIPRLDEVAWST